jgi:hypothetical protein
MKNRTVFLSGKVTGLPRWWVVLKFLFWDLFYTGMGYEVKNPTNFIDPKTSYSDAMKTCFEVLETECDFIYFIPGYRNSTGAMLEFSFAARTNKTPLNSSKSFKFIFDLKKRMNEWDKELERKGSMKLLSDINNIKN